jgi:hypothetical protein
MSEKITKLVASYLLKHGVKGSEIEEWRFKVREVDGRYFFDIATTIAVTPKSDLTPEEGTNRTMIIVFVVSLLLMLSLSTLGLLLPNADLGRELVYLSTLPGFVAQLIGARFLVWRYYRNKMKSRLKESRTSDGEHERGPEVPPQRVC